MARTLIEKPDEKVEIPPDAAPPEDILAKAIDIFDEEFAGLNLFGKIARISGMIGSIPKRGYNAFHKYNYVMEADLVGAVRAYLAAAKIIIIPHVHTVEKDGDLTTVMVTYTVTDGTEEFVFDIPGTGADRGDKGVYKAMTGSQKYAIMKLFKVETGDDPEADTRVDERAASSERRERPTIRRGERGGVQRGGHTSTASPVQLRRISELTAELGLSREALLANVVIMFGVEAPDKLPDDEREASQVVLGVLKALSSEQAGQLIEALADQVNDRKFDAESDANPY